MFKYMQPQIFKKKLCHLKDNMQVLKTKYRKNYLLSGRTAMAMAMTILNAKALKMSVSKDHNQKIRTAFFQRTSKDVSQEKD